MTAKPLEFGTAFHKGFEVYYNPDTWDMPREVVSQLAIKAFVDRCEVQRRAALEVTGQVQLDDEVQQDYNERVELGRGMFKHYFEKLAPALDRGFRPVKVEIQFMVPIPHPDTGELMYCKCFQCLERMTKYNIEHELPGDRDSWIGLPVVYAGRIDMLAQDQYGNYWIYDWKTAAAITVSGEKDEFLELDDQIGSYIWALRSIGINVLGFIYREIKKGYPQPPAQNVYRRKGCLFSKNKQQNTDYETYQAHVAQYDAEAFQAGLYDEFLQFLQAEGIVYYSNHQIMKSETQCIQIQKGIGEEALDMLSPTLRVYPSPGRFSCRFCAFRQPCLGVFAGEDYQYTLDTLFEKKEHYYLREEASTESKGAE